MAMRETVKIADPIIISIRPKPFDLDLWNLFKNFCEDLICLIIVIISARLAIVISSFKQVLVSSG